MGYSASQLRSSARQFASQNALLIGVLVIVGALVVGPLVVLLVASVGKPGTLPFQTTTLTLENYWTVLKQPHTLTLVRNTFVYAFSSVAFGGCVAVALAWLTERTDIPGRTTTRVLLFSWMAVPPLVFGYGWILLINPGNGALNVALRSLFGLENAPLTPYSMLSLIVISGLSLVPTAFVMTSGLLRNMDPSLEDSAFVHGASRFAVLRKVTLPLLTPGLLSTGIFLFIGMVQTFDLPLIIGTTAQIPVLSTRIYLLALPDTGAPNYGLAGAFGMFLLLLAFGLMWIYFRVTRVTEKFRVVTGRNFRPRRVKLGSWRGPALLFVGCYLGVMLLPLLILLWTSLLPFYRVPNLADLSTISLDSYRRVLSDVSIKRAALNTIILVLSSATLVMTLACVTSWLTLRTRGAAGRLVDVLSFAPNAIPPVVMAVAILLLFLKSPLYGTIWVLVAGHVATYLAFGTRTMGGAFIQIHKDLENAAIVSGAGRLTMFRRVLVPLVWPHIVNGWLWVVAHSARDLTFPLILLTTANIVISASIYVRWGYPDHPAASALSILLVGSLVLLVVPIQLYMLRDKQAEAVK